MYELIRDDLAAMREARRVSFHHGPHVQGIGPDETLIRCTYEYQADETPKARDLRLFPKFRYQGSMTAQWERDIVVQTRLSDYDSQGEQREYSCFEMIHAAQFDRAWQTTVDTLKTGDVIGIKWVGSNNSDFLRDRGLANDEVYLFARRLTTRSNVQKQMEWFLSARVAEVDSPSRFVRVGALVSS